jgi:Flp pilus assembly protein TadB
MGFTAVFAAATFIGVNEAKKRERRQERAMENERKVNSAQRAHEARKARRAQIREARKIQAEQQNLAATTGQTGSSAAVAAQGSVSAALGTNVGDINTALQLGEAQGKAQMDVFKAGQKSDLERLAGVTQSITGAYAGK